MKYSPHPLEPLWAKIKPPDYDPLTIGRVRGMRPRFWSPGRILLLVIVVLVIASLLLPSN